jgi:hypothetical protein
LDMFPTGTTFWGADFHAINTTDPFEVVVTGGSGILSVTGVGVDFWGFVDPLEISSLTFRDTGQPDGATQNFSWDNVTTAGAAVPTPPALTLLIPGLLGLCMARHQWWLN